MAAEFHAALGDALKAAQAQPRPILVLIRREGDAASLDAGHWLEQGDLGLHRFHVAVLWSGQDELKQWPQAPRAGFLYLTADGKVAAVAEVPARRAELPELLDLLARHPVAYTEWAARAAHDKSLLKRAVEVLEGLGRADEALALLDRMGYGPNAPAEGERTPELIKAYAELHVKGPAHVARRLRRAADPLETFSKNEKAQVLSAADANRLLEETLAGIALPVEAQTARETLGTALEKLGAEPKSGEALKTGREAAGAYAKLLTDRQQVEGKEAEARQKAWREQHAGAIEVELELFREALEKMQRNPEGEAEVQSRLSALLARPLAPDEWQSAIGAVAYALLMLDDAALSQSWIERMRKEAPLGRNSADAFLDLADSFYAAGDAPSADKLYELSEKASAEGESPVLHRAARAMRALAGGKDGPNRSRWAKRTVKDVLVLVEDMDSYLAALAAWTPDEFFPVLFKDDLYAPRFAGAFKPAQVLVLPAQTGAAALSPERLRRTLLASWTEKDEDLPATVSAEMLQAAAKKLDAPRGVVFGDPASGEVAGGLALAAGRFQGFEVLDVPEVGEGEQRRKAQPNDSLNSTQAWTLAVRVYEGLANWGLPRDDTWAAVTLAGEYPYRYRGETYERWGNTCALDDTIGRRPDDHTRIAAVGRLMGDHARSAYQAMCSLFLQPERAFLFNTYGTNPKSIWGRYRMDFSAAAWKDRLTVTHLKEKDAHLGTYRAETFPWNPYGLLTINSSGGARHWSVGGGGGNDDDFPVGEPVAIHVTHSGSSADLYNPDSLAGRAIWGGAFFYFGSTAEPFLTSFQPPSYYGPRIAAGSPLALVFRQRSAQNFWMPWRLMITGDPLFALRDKPAERKPLKSQKRPLVRDGEAPLSASAEGDAYARWLHELRVARWRGTRGAALALAEKPPANASLDAESLPLVLEEFLRAVRLEDAAKTWQAAPAAARDSYAARVYARQAFGALLDRALLKKDLPALQTHYEGLLTTVPFNDFADRWLGKLLECANEGEGAEFDAWLTACAAKDELKTYQPLFQKRIDERGYARLVAKPAWDDADLDAALSRFAASVKRKAETRILQQELESLFDAALAKREGLTPEVLQQRVNEQFETDGEDHKRLKPALEGFVKQRALHKDCLLLGGFEAADAGSWEKIAPNGKPDFSATYSESGRKIAWQRPFKPGSFGIVDLVKLLKPNVNCYAYAAVNVTVAAPVDGFLLLGSDDGVTAHLAGQEIHKNLAARGVTPDQDKVAVKLEAGTHLLMLRIDQGGGGWGFCVRFADADGKPLAGVTLTCPEKQVAP
ncbi:MAG: hypothetical protein HS116_15850 [Planctomycetes bacterium]|nr:hypothetical protein [Planctomycetota bacterium]